MSGAEVRRLLPQREEHSYRGRTDLLVRLEISLQALARRLRGSANGRYRRRYAFGFEPGIRQAGRASSQHACIDWRRTLIQ